MATISLSNVSKRFSGVEIIRNVNLEIEDREFAVVVGPSGCGKSTLLRLVAGLEELSAGDLWIDGERVNDVPPARRGLAMVFQSYALYPHMSVAGNLGFSLKLSGVAREERDRRVLEAARVLRIESLLGRKPRDLSGGERQRTAIGRAIVRNPKAFLLDEPLSNLDAALRAQMRIEILRLHRELNATTIYVTHDQVEAMTMADRIVVLREGAVEQVGSPLELYHRPQNLFVAGFIGAPKMNFLPAEIGGGGNDFVSVTLSGGTVLELPAGDGLPHQGAKVSLGIRPEHLELSDAGQLRGEVQFVERLGAATLLHVQIQGGEMLAVEADGETVLHSRDRVRVRVNREKCHIFDETGKAVARDRPRV